MDNDTGEQIQLPSPKKLKLIDDLIDNNADVPSPTSSNVIYKKIDGDSALRFLLLLFFIGHTGHTESFETTKEKAQKACRMGR